MRLGLGRKQCDQISEVTRPEFLVGPSVVRKTPAAPHVIDPAKRLCDVIA
jgi:hypothetical protein